ncbi:GNAT family N-acetyltransferase [Francisella philomiragia]|uniref:BioF2-like acetyltransferase domain-containing protein n=1 Tax=Francisella philomiragia subsp. philomiragia (strain ATCC 25017 / CCUG 19701 / FSC 153 / O\|nr:GNAT family N-acetyltransferase [Francisella philomiragia]AJI47694.1 femAB family protein [Francisella philomiragia]AJI49376.1 femAB family protein [Francisella philomiragia]MBK2020723.1 GNAT family N-acetyltransferase [Francisella philomiragia]MBK2030857.1 GNAT family N-acetyltransferase [Francisella philomiragia]MBK2263485.1 GNAT family N-acetyltransferase [Francisella philomiragia]
MKLIRYTADKKQEWDLFVANAKNSHFMFYRDYMDYHSDRFKDFSLMFYDEKGKILGLLPANVGGDVLYSHQGLTFGGFLIDTNLKTKSMLELFNVLKRYLLKQNIKKIIYKCIPYIYSSLPSEEDRYALYVNEASLIRRDVTTTILLDNKIKYQEQRKRAIKKAFKNGLIIEESSDYNSYWSILRDALKHPHNATPVHNEDEIKRLAQLFPNNIKLFVVKDDEKILAGTVIFENSDIVHTQYLASSEQGRKVGALDFVLDYLISNRYQNKKYFDFGISNEDDGKYLNEGLIAQKEGFGARAVVHDFYEIRV